MGIQLSGIVQGTELALDQLAGKRVAIDAFNWMYQFLASIRQLDGTPLKDSKGRITSHLSGLFYRTLKLLEADVRPIYVFDGPMPAFKKKTADERRDARAEAMREWQAALDRKDFAAARKFAQRSMTLTGEMITEGKQLLAALGIPVIDASSEGEALCSLMAAKGDAYAAATQDYDSLLFGCPRLVRNLSITGKKKRGLSVVDVKPELVILDDVLATLGITREQLIVLGILVGTDYNPGGVPGFGPKRALDLVKAKQTLEGVMADVVWDFDVSAEEIYAFFLAPHEAAYELEFRDPDEEAIRQILCNEHEFSEERITSALTRLAEKRGRGQKSLDKWF